MMTPCLHLNGSGVDNLKTPLLDAISALSTAVLAVLDAAPNARDYYPIGPTAYQQAQSEHSARLEALKKVSEELETIYLAIEDQERQRRR